MLPTVTVRAYIFAREDGTWQGYEDPEHPDWSRKILDYLLENGVTLNLPGEGLHELEFKYENGEVSMTGTQIW